MVHWMRMALEEPPAGPDALIGSRREGCSMRVTPPQLRAMKRRGEKIAMATAYDYPMARLLDRAGLPVLLVGDSLGMVVLGHGSTIPVTVDDIIHHTQAVVRGSERALVVADLPFMSYRIDQATALRNATALMQHGGAQAVKLEGAGREAETVARLVACGIPVMGHLGLTPQSVYQFGGYRLQGRGPKGAERLLAEAHELEEAGAFAIVLELVSHDVAADIARSLAIPIIGIGAGQAVDGQVQVLHDLLGLSVEHVPQHAARYVDLAAIIDDAARRYLDDVANGRVLGAPAPDDVTA